MHLPHLVVVLASSCTWAGFAVAMRRSFRFAKEKTPAKTWLTWSAFVCTLLQLATVAVVKPPTGPIAWLGLGCFIVANVMLYWSLSVHGKARPAFAFIQTAPASFAHTGPYRFVRHPIYTAYLLAWLAGPLVTAQFWLLATVGWMWLFYYRAAWQEEQIFSASPFAAQYQEYKKQTGMFFPRPT
jgi:protein-S-isoprenylcysteine O-methyltransferase Ste14